MGIFGANMTNDVISFACALRRVYKRKIIRICLGSSSSNFCFVNFIPVNIYIFFVFVLYLLIVTHQKHLKKDYFTRKTIQEPQVENKGRIVCFIINYCNKLLKTEVADKLLCPCFFFRNLRIALHLAGVLKVFSPGHSIMFCIRSAPEADSMHYK